MENCHATVATAAGDGSKRRALDEDDDDSQLVVTDGDRKKFKPDLDNEQNDEVANKWNLLPFVVYELLMLFKSSDEPQNSAGDDKTEEKQNKIFNTLNFQETPLNIITENPKKNHEYAVDKKISDDISRNENCQEIPLNIITENPKVNHEYAVNEKISLDNIEPSDNVKLDENRKVSKELKLYDLLNLSFSNVKMPTTKPPACICKYCSYVDNLPITQSAVNSVLALNNNSFELQHNKNHKILNSDMYPSNIEVCSICAFNDCYCVNKSYTMTRKNVWTNELMDLMRKNEITIKDDKNKNVNTSNSVLCIKKMYEAKKHVKKSSALYKKYKRSKYSTRYACKKYRRSKYSTKHACKMSQHPKKNFFHRSTHRQ